MCQSCSLTRVWRSTRKKRKRRRTAKEARTVGRNGPRQFQNPGSSRAPEHRTHMRPTTAAWCSPSWWRSESSSRRSSASVGCEPKGAELRRWGQKHFATVGGGGQKRRGETLESSNSPEHSSTSPQKPELDFSSDDSAAILCCDWFIFRNTNAEFGQEVVLNFERFSHMCFSSSPVPKYHTFQSENVRTLVSDFSFAFFFLCLCCCFFFFVSPKNFLLLWKMFGCCLLSSALPLSCVSLCLPEEDEFGCCRWERLSPTPGASCSRSPLSPLWRPGSFPEAPFGVLVSTEGAPRCADVTPPLFTHLS